MQVKIPLSKIKADARLQHRVGGLDAEHVAALAERLTEDKDFDLPPIDAVQEESAFHVWDGWHRVEAYRAAKRRDIPASVSKGDWRDAWVKSLGANALHGKGRTNADIEAVLKATFADKETAKNSDSEIARIVGVNRSTVTRWRERLSCAPAQDAPRSVTRNGTTYPMNTANIGRKPTPKPQMTPPLAEEPAAEEEAPVAATAVAELPKAEVSGKPEPKQPKPGSVVFDDRQIGDVYGKLVRLVDQRANAHDCANGKGHKECLDALETFANAWKRWQREKK